MHLPVHPIWFWLIALAPWFLLLALWAAANGLKVPLKPLARWLWAGYFLLFVPYFIVNEMNGHKTLRLVVHGVLDMLGHGGLDQKPINVRDFARTPHQVVPTLECCDVHRSRRHANSGAKHRFVVTLVCRETRAA
jgi:hypothetical protein